MVNVAKVVGITSVKGGTGKTINTLNIAGILSKQNKKVLIIDLDLYSADIPAMLNIDAKTDLYTMYLDTTNNSFNDINDYITKYNDQIDILCSPKDPRYSSKINSKLINLVLYKLKNKYDVILIDMNHILNEINLVTMDQCDYLLYVLNNSPMDIKNMKTMVSILNDMGMENYKIILYDAKDLNKKSFTKFDIQTIVKEDITYRIPSSFYLKDIDKYIMDGSLLTLNPKIRNSHKDTIKVYEKITESLVGENNE